MPETDDRCAKCDRSREDYLHDSSRWPGRLSTGAPYHKFVARDELTLDDLEGWRPNPAPSGRSADQFPGPTSPASNWVEVSPNIGGGITVTSYEAGIRDEPQTYNVVSVGMSVSDARALAARLIEHADVIAVRAILHDAKQRTAETVAIESEAERPTADTLNMVLRSPAAPAPENAQ